MTLLDIVTESRELRDLAAKEHARAIVRASDAGHSLREIARAAGMRSFSGVAWIIKRERSARLAEFSPTIPEEIPLRPERGDTKK